MALTLIYTYYNQTEMLQRQLENWASYPEELKQQIRIMLVDDCSKTPVSELVGEPDFHLEIYRVMEDMYCNIGGARNLGTKVCETEWMFHSDMDHILPPSEAEKVVALAEKNERKIYKFQRIDPESGKTKIHPGTMLLTRKVYWEVGGCDEDFVGNYGQTDIHFFYRADPVVETEMREDVQMVIHHIGETEGIDRAKREPNRLLFEQKKESGNWSTDYVRFPWEKQR
tara:strand:- start:1238 stop:1918 length:681 start_codon:yes stop_codon:yes gene_type:complete